MRFLGDLVAARVIVPKRKKMLSRLKFLSGTVPIG